MRRTLGACIFKRTSDLEAGRHMLLEAQKSRPATLPPGPPRLCVVIDTEEEFDWGRPLSRNSRSVASIAAQERAQAVFRRHGIVPTYVVDYPVASDPDAAGTLKGFLDRGECEIGTHLHPWVNPPDEEAVTSRNSYPGNLPENLEREKLERLTETIERAFGSRPLVYRAGRYGAGPNTAKILSEMGYLVDSSVAAFGNFTDDGGPDYSLHSPTPYWLDAQRQLLEVPLSCGLVGILRHSPQLFRLGNAPLAAKFRAAGVLSKAGLIERIRLSPEGIDLPDQERLTKSLLRDGHQVFVYSYHSPSLEVGHTPYVQSEGDLQAFLERMDGYFRFFFDTLGGKPSSLTEVYASAR